VIVGVPKEVKVREYRVGMVPATVRALVEQGHDVLLETQAGVGSGIGDADYQRVGGRIVPSADEVWRQSEMVVKVKEPVASEYEKIRSGQIIYTYFHLAAVPELAKVLIEKKVSAVAYETIQLPDRSLPLLRPMSEVAGRMSIGVGARCLEKEKGGKGILLGGVPGVRRGRVAILGGGVVGTNAAKIAVGLGAEVTILDVNLTQLAYLDDVFLGRISTLASDSENIARCVREADLVVGAVLVPGRRAPQLVSEALVKEMSPGSVVVDVAVDQGGCIETCRPTTHENPTYIEHGVVHYGVTNMPGAVPHTSTFALTQATAPYALKIASKGLIEAVRQDSALAWGLTTHGGVVTSEPVAHDLSYPYIPALDALAWAAKG
jgi:alanine dehydrogenase